MLRKTLAVAGGGGLSGAVGVWGGRAIKRLEEEEVRVSEDFELSWAEGTEKEGDRCENVKGHYLG